MSDTTTTPDPVENEDDWGTSDEEKPAPPVTVEDPAFTRDKQFYRMVVWFLGISVMVGIIGILLLAGFTEKGAPEGLIAIISSAIGALAGVLTARAR